MAQATPELDQFWEQKLKTMPKKKVQDSLKEIGFTLPTSNLSADQVRKVLYGFLAQLEKPLQRNAIELIRNRE
jgi:hypothetical protein